MENATRTSKDELNARLIRAANNSGGVDNITVVTVRVP